MRPAIFLRPPHGRPWPQLINRQPTRRSLSGADPRGVALLEVLLACVIFALVVLALARTYSATLATARLSNLANQATLGLQNRINQTLSQNLRVGEQDWPGSEDEVQFHVRVQEARGTGLAAFSSPGLLRVTVSAHWENNGAGYDREASYLKYQP